MTKRSSSKTEKNTRAQKKDLPENGAWIPARGGLIAVGIATLALAIWVTVQAMKVADLGESLLWGLGFAASIWVIFGVVFAINRFLRGR